MHLWSEIRRRNVHRVAITYVAAAWLLIQVVETLFPVFGLSDTAIRTVVILVAIGLVPAVILSWLFEWTPEGLRRDSETSAPASGWHTRRFDAAIIGLLLLAVVYFAVDKFVVDPQRDKSREELVAAQARGDAVQQEFGRNSIAVLAFKDISEAGDLGYFADGIAEELLNLLARIPELRVAGRTSAFSFKDKPATIPEIGEALGVSYIVQGSVRTASDRIRITVQFIEAASDTQLFSKNYDRDFDDIFDIQDEVAASVVAELQISLLDGVPLAKRADPRAFALYLQARTIANDDRNQDVEYARVKPLIERALEIDPNYGEALSVYSLYLWLFGEEGFTRAQSYERVRRLHTRALAIDPNNANALAGLGSVALLLDNDIETAARLRKRAHEVDPTNIELLRDTTSLSFYGRADLAVRIGQYIVRRDPLCIRCYTNLADAYILVGDLESARQVLREGLELAPDRQWGQIQLGRTFLLSAEPETAWENMPRLGPNPAPESIYPGYLEVLYDLGHHEEFEELLPGFIKWHEENGYPLINAQLYAWIGDEDEAFRWLDKHDRQMTYALRVHLTQPWYRNLHGDPRWQALLEEYQMTEEVFERLDFDIRLPPGIEP